MKKRRKIKRRRTVKSKPSNLSERKVLTMEGEASTTGSGANEKEITRRSYMQTGNGNGIYRRKKVTN